MCHLGKTRRKKYEGISQKWCGTTRTDEKSRGIDTYIVDVFVMIKPTAPFRLGKHETLRKRNWSDSVDNSFPMTDDSRCEYKKINLIKSSYKRPVVSQELGELVSTAHMWTKVGNPQ